MGKARGGTKSGGVTAAADPVSLDELPHTYIMVKVRPGHRLLSSFIFLTGIFNAASSVRIVDSCSADT